MQPLRSSMIPYRQRPETISSASIPIIRFSLHDDGDLDPVPGS